MLALTNSTNKKKIKLNTKKITIYNCGPTVYNHIHIGNLRPLVTFDVLYRYLLNQNKHVKYVHNLTDIDDKIINVAQKNKTTEKKITQKYIHAYLKIFKDLNIKKMFTPKVSDYINDIIKYIQKLINAKIAYNVNGNVYFDIKKIKNYGAVSHKNIKQLLDGVRITNKLEKRFPLDFTLWKKTNIGLNWKNPFSQEKGRPGWHTECCVLINKLIGQQVTIHGGGIDLKFPHHENENAQNQGLFKKDLAKIWMHVGHVNVNGKKMAKSLNNYVLVKDIVTKQNANGIRWFFYKTKYENPIDYSQNNLIDAINEIDKITKNLAMIKTILIANNEFKKLKQDKLSPIFCQTLNDDLNLPNAIMVIFDNLKKINILFRQKNYQKTLKIYWEIISELDILGITMKNYDHDKNLNLIYQWKKTISLKKFSQADLLRKKLIKKNLL